VTIQRDSYLREIQGIRGDVVRTLDGMDYCLDWKLDDDEWSAREVVYHLVDTPSRGIHEVLKGMLVGSIQEVSLTGGLINLTSERQEGDLDRVRADVEAVLVGVEMALSSATDTRLVERSVIFNLISKGTREERTAQTIVEHMVIHWRSHLGQLAAIRDALGLDWE